MSYSQSQQGYVTNIISVWLVTANYVVSVWLVVKYIQTISDATDGIWKKTNLNES